MQDLGVNLGHSSPRSRAVDDEGTEQGLTRLSSGFKPRRLPEAEPTVSTGAHRPRAPDFPARQFRAQRRLHAGCSPVSVHSDLSTSPLSLAMAVSGLLRVHVALVSHCPTDPVFLCPPCLLQDMSRDAVGLTSSYLVCPDFRVLTCAALRQTSVSRRPVKMSGNRGGCVVIICTPSSLRP